MFRQVPTILHGTCIHRHSRREEIEKGWRPFKREWCQKQHPKDSSYHRINLHSYAFQNHCNCVARRFSALLQRHFCVAPPAWFTTNSSSVLLNSSWIILLYFSWALVIKHGNYKSTINGKHQIYKYMSRILLSMITGG